MPHASRTLLLVTRHPPIPEADGAGAYVGDLARYLAAAGWRVHIAWTEPSTRIRWAGHWRQPASLSFLTALHLPAETRLGPWHFFPQTFWGPFKARAQHALKCLLQAIGLWPKKPTSAASAASPSASSAPSWPEWERLAEPHEIAFADQVAARIRPDVVIANYPWMTPIFAAPHLRASVPVCLDHDVAWKRFAHQHAGRAPRPDDITLAMETALLARARVVVAISAEDAREFSAMVPAARVVIAPKSSPVVTLPPAPPAPCLLFVGSNNKFNAEGLAWFLDDVWPLIRRARPAATLSVCGGIDQAVAARPPGVTFHGRVPALEPYYAAATLVIAPLRHATGLNIKLVEALAHGKPCVTTAVTLGGAPFLREAVVLAHDAESFAHEVTALLADPVRQLALATRAHAVTAQYFSPAACYDPLVAALDAEVRAFSLSPPSRSP